MSNAMKLSNSRLAVIQDAKNKLNALRNRVPCGIRSIDDEVDRKIKSLEEFIERALAPCLGLGVF